MDELTYVNSESHTLKRVLRVACTTMCILLRRQLQSLAVQGKTTHSCAAVYKKVQSYFYLAPSLWRTLALALA